MTINQISPESSSMEPTRVPLSGTDSARQLSTRKEISQHVDTQPRKDASDLSKLSKLMAKTAQALSQDMEVRPNKVALARTMIEQGGPLSDEDIDATWDKMLPLA